MSDPPTVWPLATNDWKNTTDRLNSGRNAINTPQLFRAIYNECKSAQAALALYKSGSDPIFNAIYNALLSATERSELDVMLNAVNNLVSDWENNHASAVAAK